MASIVDLPEVNPDSHIVFIKWRRSSSAGVNMFLT